MRVCEFCGAENADIAKHCAACNEPMTAQDAAEDVKATEVLHHKQLIQKEIIYGAIAAVVIAALVVAVIRNQRRKAVREEVRHYYTAMLDSDDSHVNQFWKCMVRSEKSPKDNLELESGLESAVVKSKGGYAKYARSRCFNFAANAASSLDGIPVPTMVADTHAAYLGGLKDLKGRAEAYIKAIGDIEQWTDQDEALKKLGSNYHYAGAESPETYAYDKFLRCVVPNFGPGVKEEQDVLNSLGPALADPVPAVAHWRKDCYPIVAGAKTATMDPDYKTKVEALSSDDRDVQAFQDVIKMSNDKERKAAHAPFVDAWYKFAQIRDAHLAKVGTFLAD